MKKHAPKSIFTSYKLRIHKKIPIEQEKKLNIAMVCDAVTDFIAGSYLSTLFFAEILKRRGHKIIFIAAKSPNNPKDNYYKDIKVYRFSGILLPKTGGKVYLGFSTVKKLKKILQDEKIDIVHAMIPTPLSIQTVKTAKSLGIKVVAHSHTQPENLFIYLPKFLFRSLNRIFYKYLVWFYKKSDVLIHPSEFSKNIFLKLNTGTRNEVVSNGVDTEKFKKLDTKKLFEKFKLPKNTKNILYVGRLSPEKNVDTLIEAAPLILEKEPNTHINIVGSGDIRSQLEKLTKKLGMEKHITFLGKINDEELIMAYHSSDIFVFPSMCELEGMAVLEAMACGKPIIIANAPESASRYFVDGNGLLFKPQDSKDLAEKIIYVLTHEDIRLEMGETSFKKSKNFDIRKSVTRLEEIYYSLLNK